MSGFIITRKLSPAEARPEGAARPARIQPGGVGGRGTDYQVGDGQKGVARGQERIMSAVSILVALTFYCFGRFIYALVMLWVYRER